MSAVVQVVLLIAVAVVATSACPKTVPVRCPDVEVKQNFDVVQYLGLWYEIERVPQVFQPNGACVTATYTAQIDTTYPVKVINRQLNDATRKYDFLVGGVRVADDAGTDGKLKVKFPVTPVESDYWVLATDYDNYALVYSCRILPGGGGIFQSAWVLARQNVLSSAAEKAVSMAFRQNGVDRSKLAKTRHDSTCNYNFPVVPLRS